MLKASDLQTALDIFSKRNVQLYHACQLQDYYSYLKLGGIASREAILANSLPLTAFDTDNNDQSNGLWNLVFGNFNDFSSTFHWGNNAVPSPYGPILIKLDCKALQSAIDLSISLRSAGAKGFSREKESLKSIDDLNKIFLNPEDSEKSYQVKFKKNLEAAFPGSLVGSLEWNMSFPNGILPIDNLVSVTVDPITVNGESLFGEVKRISSGYHKLLGSMVTRSKCHPNFGDLISAVHSGAKNLNDLKRAEPALEDWANGIERIKLEYQFERYASYTNEGTLKCFGKFSSPKAA